MPLFKPEEILAVIPARGGSKGIPGKNIAPLAGRPLLSYTIEAARQSGRVQQVWVSTDCPQIAAIAQREGAGVIERPPELSGDTASTESALMHALDWSEAKGLQPRVILTLPATSPLRTGETIRRCLEQFEKGLDCYDALLTLHEVRDYFWRRAKDGATFQPLFPGASRRRQEREPLFSENSAVYVTLVAAFRETGFILGQSAQGFVLSPREAVDINLPEDLALAEALLKLF